MEAKPKCEFCGKIFSSESCLRTHINTAKYCISKRPKIAQQEQILDEPLGTECEYCGKLFAQKIHFRNHVPKCKSAPIVIKKQQLIDELMIEKQQLIDEMVREKQQLINEMIINHKQIMHEMIINHNQTMDELIYEKKQILNALLVERKESKKIKKELDRTKKDLDAEKDEVNKLEIRVDIYEKEVANHKHNTQMALLECAHSQGQIIGLKTAKPTTKTMSSITNYVNPKLANVPIDNIRPLTIEYIQEETHNFTLEMFRLKAKGIVQFLKPIFIVDNKNSKPSRNYVCTDMARHKYHKLIESGEWELDSGATFLSEILDQLKDETELHWLEFDRLIEDEIHEEISQNLKLEKGWLLKTYFGITISDGSERTQLITDIRTHLKKIINI